MFPLMLCRLIGGHGFIIKTVPLPLHGENGYILCVYFTAPSIGF
jgi:hypothetical protein